MSARRILITGATGGLGLALAKEALARGHYVRATGRSPAAGKILSQLGAEFVPFDLAGTDTDPAALAEGCHSVIHAAALSASWGRKEDFKRINFDATSALLKASRSAGASRFVFISSPSIFADFRDRKDIAEGDLPASPPLNHYARTKLAAERLVLSQADSAMACCAIRPRALVGEGDRVILPHLAKLAQRARMPLPRGGRAMIELTDLRDAASAICEAEARLPAIRGAAINISGGQAVDVKTLAGRVAKALGHTPDLVNLPVVPARILASMLEAGARLAQSSREPVLTRYTLATLAYSQTFDPAPARRLLDYIPRHDGVETLLREARRHAEAGVAA